MTPDVWQAPPPDPRPYREPGRRRRRAVAFLIGLLVGLPFGYAVLFPWLVERADDDPAPGVVAVDDAQRPATTGG